MAINREAMKAIPIKAYLDHKAIGYEPHGRNTIHLTEKKRSWISCKSRKEYLPMVLKPCWRCLW